MTTSERRRVSPRHARGVRVTSNERALEEMTREQMVAEFGEPGVQNPKMMDLITVDEASGDVVLVMMERRRWGEDLLQLRQMEEKINRYLAYALDGFLVEHHPRFLGKRVRIRLDCVEAPHGEATAFLEAATHAIRGEGLDFVVNVAQEASAAAQAAPPPPPP